MKVKSWITATMFVGMIGLWGVMLNPTIAQVISQVSAEDQAALEEARRLTEQIVKLYQQGKYDEAFLLAEKALAIFRQQLGDSHIEIAPSLNNLARLYESQGRYAEAALLYEQALAIYKQQLGENHLDTGIGFNNLAGLYESQGRYAEAEVLHQKALAIFRQQLGSNHFNTAISLNNLAYLYYSQGRYTEAEPLYQQALAIFKQQSRDNHPDTAFTLSNLGLLYYSQGRYAEAEPLYKEALAIRKQQLGDNHPDTATSLNNLALLYKYQGRYAEAEPVYKEALAITKQQLGDNHADTATSLHNLALLYHSQERYAEAAPLLVEALTIRIEQLGVNHPDTINTINNFTAFYDSQGKYAETELLYQQVLAIRKQQLGENHPDTATSLNNLAYLYYSQKKYTKAEALWQEALTIRKQQLGDNHPQIASNFNDLATLYQSQENISQAVDYLTQGIAVEEYNISENLNIGDEKQKRDYMSTISGTTDRVISLNLQSAPNNPQATQLALKTILERKGRILDVSTNSLQILRQRTDDPESQQLLTQLIEVRTQLSNLTFTPVDKFPSPEVYRQLLTEVQTKAKNLEDKISRRSAEFRQLSQPITLEGIQQQIPENSALVEIMRYRPFNAKDDSFGTSRYAVYILFPNGEIKAKDLGEAEPIDNDLIYFRDNLRDRQTPIEQVKESSRELDAKLMQSIRELLANTKTILLSPDGALNLIPFEALVTENNKYLIEENYQITYLTSGRDLLRLKEKFASEQPPLILADPIYNKEGEEFALNPSTDQLRSSAFCERGTRNFPRLDGTEEEGKQVKQLFPQATIVTGSQATENVLKQVKRPEILHIATHGFFCPTNNNDQSPQSYENPLLKSGLVLAGVKVNESAGDDGVLTALETTALNLVGTKLVVLSACETGRGDITTGEGVYGL
nr:tetratricopeptide repeat protein [Crocosphaera sp.]